MRCEAPVPGNTQPWGRGSASRAAGEGDEGDDGAHSPLRGRDALRSQTCKGNTSTRISGGGGVVLGQYLDISLGLGGEARARVDSRSCPAQSWTVCFTLGSSTMTSLPDHSPAHAFQA